MRQGLIKNGAAVKVRALYLLNTGLKACDLMPGVAAVKPADSPARPGLASCTASPRRARATPRRGAARAHPQARVLLFCDVKRRAAEPARGTVKQALGLTLAHRIGFGQFVHQRAKAINQAVQTLSTPQERCRERWAL